MLFYQRKKPPKIPVQNRSPPVILKKSLEGISQKVLTDSLRSMEADGIITRTIYPEVPPRVEYALNDLGQSMRPIIMAMEEWGINYKRQL